MKVLDMGVSYDVKASRTRGKETITVHLTANDTAAAAWFYLTRDEAYALACELQHEADWLAQLHPQPEVAA